MIDLTDAAYVEKNPTITGTSLESLNIYHIGIFEHQWFRVQTLDLNRIFIEIPLVSAPVSKFRLHRFSWRKLETAYVTEEMLVTDSLHLKVSNIMIL